jgi:hypothetical protein
MTGLGTASAGSAGQQPTSTRLRLTLPISLAAPISNGVARVQPDGQSAGSRPLKRRMTCGGSAYINITRLTENLTAATVLAVSTRPEADPDFVNKQYALGRSHVDAHH